MTFQVRTETRPCRPDYDGTVYVLEDPATGCRAEVWPALGFNCLHWRSAHDSAGWLWSDPQVFDDPHPGRSGIPILFPFPNRIRAGRFTWEGEEYQLPINDPQQQNAIHGFVCYRPWRVVASGTTVHPEPCAWVKGGFQGSRDAADCRSLWPADYRLEITYTLSANTLRVSAVVTNPDTKPLPFGLGFHSYFRFSPNDSQFRIVQPAGRLARWVLEECLPTGACQTRPEETRHWLLVEPDRWDYTLHWDDAFRVASDVTMPTRTRIEQASTGKHLEMTCEGGFRDLVVFTPPHRQALCLEPYTCTTDAVNLHQRGIDTGLMVLPPGGQWRGGMRLSGVAHVG